MHGLKYSGKLLAQSMPVTKAITQASYGLRVLTSLAGGDVGGRAISTAHQIENCDKHIIVGEGSKVSHYQKIIETRIKDEAEGGIGEVDLVVVEWSIQLCGWGPLNTKGCCIVLQGEHRSRETHRSYRWCVCVCVCVCVCERCACGKE